MFEPLDDLRPKYGASLQNIAFWFFSQMQRNSSLYHCEIYSTGKKKELAPLEKRRN